MGAGLSPVTRSETPRENVAGIAVCLVSMVVILQFPAMEKGNEQEMNLQGAKEGQIVKVAVITSFVA
ncbi:hypothetical protein PHISCL_10631 [Aspergillus sclerotialis]|uniref:Uncharacterized protein n=1 Tax=Aspergillus sclerotialis TaxID=2070753 RepID=A0A3A2Z1S0_9EURO|nr:hypothetical protein PHISCL_10631 [Aspergillus sclerotialis]